MHIKDFNDLHHTGDLNSIGNSLYPEENTSRYRRTDKTLNETDLMNLTTDSDKN